MRRGYFSSKPVESLRPPPKGPAPGAQPVRCDVCGAETYIERIDATPIGATEPRYVEDRRRCPNELDHPVEVTR